MFSPILKSDIFTPQMIRQYENKFFMPSAILNITFFFFFFFGNHDVVIRQTLMRGMPLTLVENHP